MSAAGRSPRGGEDRGYFCEDFPTKGYDVPRDGRVWSRKLGERRELAYGLDEDGYVTVQLTENRKSWVERVHRLVCAAFNGMGSASLQVRHLDGVKRNNVASNLAWGTAKENADDRARHARTARGERQGASKLTERDVVWLREQVELGRTQTSLAKFLGVSIACVNFAVRGRNWGWL